MLACRQLRAELNYNLICIWKIGLLFFSFTETQQAINLEI